MVTRKHVVIIGNGAAGNSAAEAIRRVNKDTQISIFAEESFPEYSACVLPDYIAEEIPREKVFIKDFDEYTKNEIELTLGKRVEVIDTVNKFLVVGKEKIPYDRLVLATGSLPRIPPIKGLEKIEAFTLKSFSDAERLLQLNGAHSFLLVGGGVIGLELAMALRKRGCDVFLVEIEEVILPRIFSREMSAKIQKILEEKGIRVISGEGVTEVAEKEGRIHVVIGTQDLKCDAIVMTAGFEPNVKLAKDSGIEIGALGGIITDNKMCTSVPGVYACGDCVESRDMISGESVLSMLWGNAVTQGEFAGLNCEDCQRYYRGAINTVCIDVFGRKALTMGSVKNGPYEERGILVEEKKEWIAYYHFFQEQFSGFEILGDSTKSGNLIYCLLRKMPFEEFKEFLSKRGKICTKGGFAYFRFAP